MRIVRRALPLILLAILILPAVAAAQSSARSMTRAAAATPDALDAATRALASQLRCPVCQGLSIQDSPSELAQQMRDVVRQQLQDGATPDQVKQYFIARYGEWVLMTPPVAGFNWLLYALPVLAFLLGGAWLVSLVRRWTDDADVAVAPDSPPAARH